MAVYKRFTIQQKYLNGVPQEEYRLGMEYESKAYHSMENCESGTECTQVEYRWVNVEGEYFCEDKTKYAKQKRQQKCVDEEEWVDMYPYQYKKGEKMEEESEDCGAQPKWTTLTIGATPSSISESFYKGLIVTPSKERYDFTDTVEIKLPTISGNVFSNVNYGSTMAYGQSTNSSVLNLTMSNNWYVQANYRPIQSYYLGVGILGNGSVIVTPDNPGRMYSEGTKVTLAASRSIGYQFVNWQYGSTTAYGSTTTNTQLDLTMNQSWYALANFSKTETPEGLLYELYSDGTDKWYGYSRSYLPLKYHYFDYSLVSIIDYSGIINIISDSAFWGCYSLQTISFPMCSYIGYGAFLGCSSLQTVNLPMCSYISSHAFEICYNLQSIDLPKCEYVGGAAFEHCHSLQTVNLPMCSYVGSSAFWQCYNLQSIYLPKCEYVSGRAFDATKLQSIDLPMCEYVGGRAFNSCFSLQTVNLPMCSYVGGDAFHNCRSLQSIDLPMCEYVGGDAFSECSSLQTANLPMCKSIGSNAFWVCRSLETINLGKCEYFGSNAFYDCRFSQTMQSIDLEKCSYIGAKVFRSFHLLQIDSTPICSYIGDEAFASCYKLQSMDLPMCKYVGSGAFEYCISLQTVNLPMCSYVGSSAFQNCPSLQTVNLPMCSYVGSSAFWQCYNLQSIDLPMCNYIYEDTFLGCHSLQTVNLPVCSYVGTSAFIFCFLLQSIDLPKCEYIGSSAFQRCSNLQSISLPKCSYVGNKAFLSCSNLQSITLGYESAVDLWDSSVFKDTKITSTTGSILVPASLVDAYKTAENWSYFSNRIFPIE